MHRSLAYEETSGRRVNDKLRRKRNSAHEFLNKPTEELWVSRNAEDLNSAKTLMASLDFPLIEAKTLNDSEVLVGYSFDDHFAKSILLMKKEIV